MSDTIRVTAGPDADPPDDSVVKVRLDLLPFGAVEQVADVLTRCAGTKYAPHGWREGRRWSHHLGCALRHMFAWARGHDVDPETGCSHLAHAAARILFLIEYQRERIGLDDRYQYPPEAELPAPNFREG